MDKIWQDAAWADYLYWQTQDKKTLKKINRLLQSIDRSGYDCQGQPEPLKGDLSGFWSVRIDAKNRIVFGLWITTWRLHNAVRTIGINEQQKKTAFAVFFVVAVSARRILPRPQYVVDDVEIAVTRGGRASDLADDADDVILGEGGAGSFAPASWRIVSLCTVPSMSFAPNPSATCATGTVSITQYALMLRKLSSRRRAIAIVRRSSHIDVCRTVRPSSVCDGRTGTG